MDGPRESRRTARGESQDARHGEAKFDQSFQKRQLEPTLFHWGVSWVVGGGGVPHWTRLRGARVARHGGRTSPRVKDTGQRAGCVLCMQGFGGC